MAREEIRIDVTAEDDASRVIADVAEQADRLEDQKVEIPVTADTSDAEAGIRRVGDAAATTGTDIGGIRGEADNSRSVLANMVGNSAQDIGELGGVAGSAGVAIGQLAEYATEGNISLKGLVATAGPMLAIGVAVSFITSKLQEAKRKADELKKVNQEIAEQLRAGKIEEAAAAIADGYEDLISKAGRAGVSVADVTRFITGQTDVLPGLDAALARTTTAAEAFAATGERGPGAIAGYRGSLQGLRDDLEGARGSLADQSGALDSNADRQRVIQGVLNDTSGALADTTRATEELTAAYDILTGRLDDEASYLSAQGAIDAVNDALADAMIATAEYGEGSEEAQDANRRLAEQLNSSKGDVLDYAGAVAGIPPEQATEITALIDDGNFAEAERRLAELERLRIAHVRVETLFPTRPPGYPLNAPWPPTGTAGATAAPATTNVTVNLPRGSRPTDVIRAVENYARRNGRGVLRR